MKFGLSDATLAKIHGVLAKHPRVQKAVIYGSRAKGNYQRGSDIDLTLYGAGLTYQDCAHIADELDELLLPYMIDLSVYDLLNHPDLQAHIQRVGQVFYQRPDKAYEHPTTT